MIEISNLNKTYKVKGDKVEAIKNVSLKINDGEIYGIIGYSGAGKSSLVRCINLLEIPDSGKIVVNGKNIFESYNVEKNEKVKLKIKKYSESKLKNVRREIGMIFQHFNLLDRLTVFDNVAFSLKYRGIKRNEIKNKVIELLELVGLTDKINSYPSELSGGQKQRVAIARALANNPSILLSDESTSALDPNATEAILELLKDLNKKLGITIVIITHEMAVIKSIADKVAVMENGEVVEEGNAYDIFANPKAQITKNFIASQSSLTKVNKLIEDDSKLIEIKEEGKLIKLQFEKESAGDSLISDVAKKFDVNINIALANIDILQDVPLGQIIVVLDGKKDEIDKAISYIKSKNVKVFDINNGGEII